MTDTVILFVWFFAGIIIGVPLGFGIAEIRRASKDESIHN